jgi:uncharacterized protein (TIGR03086 family)
MTTNPDLRPLLKSALAQTTGLVEAVTPDQEHRPTACTEFDGRDFAERADKALAAWSDDSVLDRTLTVPWGTMPGFAVLGGYVMEVTTHSWDLADATGRTAELDPELSEAALGVAQRALPAERDGFPFDPPVAVPDDADPHTRLAAWMGRRPVAAA